MSAEPFPVTRVAEVSCDLGRPRWLIEPLWAAAGVGVLGGQPKTCKTWMAIDIALSVASSTPCLDTFPVAYPGPVLLFLAEDSADSTYERISGICQHRCIDLDKLDLFLLTTPVLRLDSSTDYQRLVATVDSLRPRLLVLDPFVRVHAVDENSASEVSRLLADLTTLKRTYDLAILLVHHARKSRVGNPGQALRGSGDLRAWGDTNLFLRQRGNLLELSGEHRYAPAFSPISLKLISSTSSHLAIDSTDEAESAAVSLSARVVEALRRSDRPLTRVALRERLRVNNKRLGDALVLLETSGQIERDPEGWRSFRSHSLGQHRNGTLFTDTSPP
jgi:hypothetical protein